MKARKAVVLSVLALAAAAAAPAPATAQVGEGRIAIMPYVGYGFYGELPDGGPTLEAALAYGGRAAYQLSEQFALFGNYQRSQPEVNGVDADLTVSHWSAGAEFSYVPRGGAEGMLPVLLEAGLGQVRYSDGFGGDSDLAVNLGIASALQLSRQISVRYGANDYISNYGDRGITNQIFVQVGAEIRF